LKKQKSELLANFGKSESDAEKNEKMLQNYLKVLENKKTEFKNFMEYKGKEAFDYFKRQQEEKNKMKEDIQKLEAKKKTRTEQIEKAKKVAQNYREILEKQNEVEEFEEPNVCYKVNQAFHNMGNRIDYSTTRFHNIMVLRHEDELTEIVSAYDKAEKETEKTEARRKSKNKEIQNFNNEVKINSLDIMKKMKTKENLKKLEEELDRLKEARKKSKNRVPMYIYINTGLVRSLSVGLNSAIKIQRL
jgi:hypothetical protein